MITEDEFPPFDESWRPSCDDHGRQIAPETFVRWLIPAGWEDTDGNLHFDVRVFHRWLGMPMNKESVRETTLMFHAMLREHQLADAGTKTAEIIVRP